MSKADCPPSCGWASLNQLKACLEQKADLTPNKEISPAWLLSRGYTLFSWTSWNPTASNWSSTSSFKSVQPVSQPSESNRSPIQHLCVQVADASNSWDFLGSCSDSWLVAIWLPSTTPGRYLGLSHLQLVHLQFSFQNQLESFTVTSFCLSIWFYTLNFFLYYYFSRVLKKQDRENIYSSSMLKQNSQVSIITYRRLSMHC